MTIEIYFHGKDFFITPVLAIRESPMLKIVYFQFAWLFFTINIYKDN